MHKVLWQSLLQFGWGRNEISIDSGLAETWQCDRRTTRVVPAIAIAWWCHQMETFSTLLAFCEGNSPVTGEFPSQMPVARSFDVFFGLCLNHQLNKQWRHWWFEMPSCLSWRHCNETTYTHQSINWHTNELIFWCWDWNIAGKLHE